MVIRSCHIHLQAEQLPVSTNSAPSTPTAADGAVAKETSVAPETSVPATTTVSETSVPTDGPIAATTIGSGAAGASQVPSIVAPVPALATGGGFNDADAASNAVEEVPPDVAAQELPYRSVSGRLLGDGCMPHHHHHHQQSSPGLGHASGSAGGAVTGGAAIGEAGAGAAAAAAGAATVTGDRWSGVPIYDPHPADLTSASSSTASSSSAPAPASLGGGEQTEGGTRRGAKQRRGNNQGQGPSDS